MVDGDRADIDKLGQIILVWSIISGPGNNVEGTVLLKGIEVFTAEFVDNFVLVVGVERI